VSARWSDEMGEIAQFGAGLPGAPEQFAALARFYAALADEPDATARLRAIFES
jgi:hypothetical protein